MLNHSSSLPPTDNAAMVDETYTDEQRVAIAKQSLPAGDAVAAVAELFKVLGDPTRLKIVLALYNNELCVGDLAGLVGVSLSAVSHQLRLLRAVRLVRLRRQGKMAYYSLDDQHVASIVAQAREHLDESAND